MIAAVAFGQHHRIAGARRLAAIGGKTVEAEPAGRQIAAVRELEGSIGRPGATEQRNPFAGLIVRVRDIDAETVTRGRKRRGECVETVVSARRHACEAPCKRDDRKEPPEAVPHGMPRWK
jgi:hypothetical protein